jgi:predicted RNase H-like HicB family nuclease
MARTYQVELERDESGRWVARVPSVPGCHTQGRSIRQAMSRIREALSLWVADADRAELIETIRLPAAARASVRRAVSARERAERAQEETTTALRQSIRELTRRESLSTRDVAELLEISPARVDQLKPSRFADSGLVLSGSRARGPRAAAKKATSKKRAARRKAARRR